MQCIGLRHGESEFNRLGLCNDDPDRAVNLTEQGRRQAIQSVRALRRLSIHRIIASELPRARQTAALIAAELGLEIATDRRLNDIRSGCEGLPVAHYLDAIAADPLNTRVNGGETLLQFHARVNAFLTDLLNGAYRAPGTTLLVTHEETLRVFKARSEGLAPAAVVGLRFANCDPYAFSLQAQQDLANVSGTYLTKLRGH
jgi:broad specificity phosphatase PhoE